MAAGTCACADVVVVGSVGIDTNIYLHGPDIDWNVEGNFTTNIDSVGQAGGYASLGYASLGLRTRFLGTVGNDPAGEQVRAAFTQAGVDARLFEDPQGTARSVNLVYPDGRRKNFYDGRGHMQFAPDLEACRKAFANSRLAHFNIPNWGRNLLPLAKEMGLTIACDIQDVEDPEHPYRRDFIRASSVLFCSGVNHPSTESLVRALLAIQPTAVIVVGRGAQGCAVATADRLDYFEPPKLDLPVRDTNGAGDALAVGFLVGHVLEGKSLQHAATMGQLAARVTCSQRVPKKLVRRDELRELATKLTS